MMKNKLGRPSFACAGRRSEQRGISPLTLVAIGVVVAFVAVIGMRVFPSVNEYWTIQRTINKMTMSGGSSVAEIRRAFDKQKDIDYSIQSISGNDLEVTKVGEKVQISFAYDKQIPLFGPAFLLIKYRGKTQ